MTDGPERETDAEGVEPLRAEYVEPDIYADVDLEAPGPASRRTTSAGAAAGPAARPGARPTARPAAEARPSGSSVPLATSAAAARTASPAAARRRLLVAGVLLVLAGLLSWLLLSRLFGEGREHGWQQSAATPSIAAAPDPASTGDAPAAPAPGGTSGPTSGAPAGLDIETASSLQVLVNKHHPLSPQDYAPDDLVAMSDIGVSSANGHSLRHDAAMAVKDMFAAAAQDGLELDMTSGYRDVGLQTSLYERYVAELGQAGADATSARPGFSEHQTGLAADISTVGGACSLEGCYAEQAGGQWLAANAWKYGFILRYPDGETATTGYEFEPWHYRYIGPEAAAAYHASGAASYEDFLGSEAAPDYER